MWNKHPEPEVDSSGKPNVTLTRGLKAGQMTSNFKEHKYLDLDVPTYWDH